MRAILRQELIKIGLAPDVWQESNGPEEARISWIQQDIYFDRACVTWFHAPPKW